MEACSASVARVITVPQNSSRRICLTSFLVVAKQIQNHPDRLVNGCRDGRGEPHTFLGVGWLAANQQGPPRAAAEVVQQRKHSVRSHPVSVYGRR